MAVYVTADLHGYPLKDFLGFLKKTGFGNDDFLFILGDVIDRNGDGGVEILRWMMCQPNVQFILGNHEKMMLDSAFVFDEITEESVNTLRSDKMDQLSGWLACGGDVTLHSLKELKHKDPELVEEMIHFCAEAPLYESVTVGSKDYLLVHSGLGNFSIEKSIESYTTDELLWTRPKLEDRYFDDVKTIIGHTPTQYYGFKYYGRALKTVTWINIDTSAAYEGYPMLLRLDDLKEFYI